MLQDADVRFYRRFTRSLSRQVRYLRRTLNQSRDGLPRLQAVIALTYAALCLEGQSGRLRAAARRLIDELGGQILPDGGHISRNPGALIELLIDLLPLRQLFSARNLPPPAALNNAIDRMMPMLRFFRHADGNFALFNGMGPTPVDLLATALAYDDARGAPVANAPHSGYQRIDAGKTALIMDTGKPPPLALSQEAHAGCLSFELSWNLRPPGGELRTAGGQQGKLAAGGEGDAGAFHRHASMTLHRVGSSSRATFRRLLFGTLDRQRAAQCAGAARGHPVDGAILRTSHDGYARRFRHQLIIACCGSPPTAARSTARTISAFRPGARLRRKHATNSPCAFTCIRR